jgi:ubiquinone/menaquinone biosynthesis C-methylase UbiE
MPVRDDPEGIELKTLLKQVTLKGKEVLELGCGDGRLTYMYFDRAKKVVAIDPLTSSIKIAKKNLPRGSPMPEFRVGRAEKLTFPDASFDVAFFTWSLCCVDIPAMGKALDEAWRVLRPDGTLVNLQPSLYQPFNKGTVSYIIQGQFGTTVDDERYRQARLALKYASLIEGKFKLVYEEEFGINTYHDTIPEVLKDLTVDCKEQYRALSPKEKRRVRDTLESMRTNEGIITRENVVLTVLTKTNPRGRFLSKPDSQPAEAKRT